MLLLTSFFSWQFLTPSSTPPPSAMEEIEIPAEYTARYQLIKCPLTKLEEEFSRKFPGRLATYRHSHGTIIFRQVHGATRRLHDSATCLSAGGFKLSPAEVETDERGRKWKTYTAKNSKNHLRVRSTVMELESDRSWASVSEWYWHAFTNGKSKRYLAITELQEETRKGEMF